MNIARLERELYRVKAKEFEFLRGKKLFVTGGTGMIMSFLIKRILLENDFDISVDILTRSKDKAYRIFGSSSGDSRLRFIEGDISSFSAFPPYDYLIHAASSTYPSQYIEAPVETILANTIGTSKVLDTARKSPGSKTLFLSSCEVYGNGKEIWEESDLGYIDLMDIRSCYNESKRMGENLCVSYHEEYGVDYVIGRLSRVYGPTMLSGDNKAMAQFIKKGLAHEDIVLKSKGLQCYDYLYVSDAVRAVLFLLENAENDVFNVARPTDLSLKDIAEFVAETCGTKVIFEIPDEKEAKSYSRATVSRLAPEKINKLGFETKVSLKEGIISTLETLQNN